MLLPLVSLAVGLALLVWSADRFIDGSAAVAKHFGVAPLIVGMIIVGFGTSAPEMLVSAIAALRGNPALALGNAIGSNIVNIALILGVTALIAPIAVHSSIVRRELPLLVSICLLAGVFLLDKSLSRFEAALLLLSFFGLLAWTFVTARNSSSDLSAADPLATELAQELEQGLVEGLEQVPDKLSKSLLWLVVGLVLMIAASRLLVWGAVTLAQQFGVSDLIIGLTIVALGTSLPELASSVMAARKGEHDIALGNIIGSNLFNITAVVGIAVMIRPISHFDPAILLRDWGSMMLVTLALFAMTYGFGQPGRINRWEGVLLLLAYVAYTGWLMLVATQGI